MNIASLPSRRRFLAGASRVAVTAAGLLALGSASAFDGKLVEGAARL